MALLLNEADVRAVLTMPMALEAVEESLRRFGTGEAMLHSRQRIEMPGKVFLNYMAAGDRTRGHMGMKIYTVGRGAHRFLVPLYSGKTGELLALMEADFLGQMRTGAATGVATQYMSRHDARIVGIVGTGLQARTQLEAVVAVRRIERICAFGRNPDHRAQFCNEMTARLGVPAVPAESAEQAVRGSDIVISATTSAKPVVFGDWLAPGVHVNAVGANFAHKRELDDEAIRRADVIAADSVEQAKFEAGDLIQAFGGEAARWSEVKELAHIVAGQTSGRTDAQQITLFKSNGIAIWDLAVASRVYDLAQERQLGLRIPLWEHCG